MALVSALQLAQRDPSQAWRFDLELARFKADYGGSSAAPVVGAAAVVGQKILGVTWAQQIKSYYCGPGTAFMIMRYHGKTKSVLESTLSLSQSNIAKPKYLNTEVSQSTDYSDFDMLRGLNRWRFGNTDGYLQTNVIPNADGNFFGMVQTDIHAGWPMAADMHESAGGAHYNNHPANRSIGHWTVISGFWQQSPYGDLIHFADPASGISGFEAANKTFWLGLNATVNFMNTDGQWGIVW